LVSFGTGRPGQTSELAAPEKKRGKMFIGDKSLEETLPPRKI
jgi:hypothetical protein